MASLTPESNSLHHVLGHRIFSSLVRMYRKSFALPPASALVLALVFASAMALALEKCQGPVVQSMVGLTSSLRGQLVKCFTIL